MVSILQIFTASASVALRVIESNPIANVMAEVDGLWVRRCQDQVKEVEKRWTCLLMEAEDKWREA